ncbi:MAG TPA: aminopeptidase [Burkholderiaceae bacterium]
MDMHYLALHLRAWTTLFLRLSAGLACTAALSSCAPLAKELDTQLGTDFGSQLNYYAQAVEGQFYLWADTKAVDDSLADPRTDAKLKAKLLKAKEIRQFAVHELGLPDNGSYKSFLALNRPYVLWNVVATPELSLAPRKWCFPIAGCVSYRGYYSAEAANEFARDMRVKGDDVQVGGVPAYSTLGWFDDPLVSTFIYYSDVDLAKLIFHELAHQMVYIPGDTQFNEAFATAVEEAGVQRWLELHASPQTQYAYQMGEHYKSGFLALLVKHRAKLDAMYRSRLSDTQKRAEKSRMFQDLRDDYEKLKQEWGGYNGYDKWFAGKLTNAHLVSVATYYDYVPAFKALLQKEKKFTRFYSAVERLSHEDYSARSRRLQRLLPRPEPKPQSESQVVARLN